MAIVRFFIFASLLSFTSYAQVVAEIRLPDTLHEASGVVCRGDYMWMINDSGNEPLLFEFLDSSLVGAYPLDVQNYDWETLTIDLIGNLYIGDIGDNPNTRVNKKIYMVPVDQIDHRWDSIHPISYVLDIPELPPHPEQHFDYDWESAVWIGGRLHFFSKNRRASFDGTLIHFATDTILEYSTGTEWVDSTVQSGSIRELNWITDATLSVDRRHLFLLTSNKIFAYLDFPERRFFDGYYMEIDLPGVLQREGISMLNDSTLVVVSEKHILGHGRIEYVDISEDLYEYHIDRRDDVTLDSNIIDSTLNLSVITPVDCPIYIEMYSSDGQVVLRKKIGDAIKNEELQLTVDTKDLSPDVYLVNVITGHIPHGYFVRKYGVFQQEDQSNR